MKIPFGKATVAAAVAVASISPAAMAASGNGHGNGKAHAHSHTGHTVMYVFKGTWNAADGTVTVTHGNAQVRHAGLLGQNVAFDLTGAKLVVADTNGDGSRTTADLKDRDKVLVKARLPHRVPGSQPFKAKMLIDQSAPTAPGAAD